MSLRDGGSGFSTAGRGWKWLAPPALLLLAILLLLGARPSREAQTLSWAPAPKAKPLQYLEVTSPQPEETMSTARSLRKGVSNVLLCGLDKDGCRTDTVMLAHLETDTHAVRLLSIPRDTLIGGDYSVPKLNSAYAVGGIGRLKDEVERLLGIPVDGYAVIDLGFFVRVIDCLGGVEYNVPQDMRYSDPAQDLTIDLKAGQQTLSGEQAMQLVRYRLYDNADIGRIAVQQSFVKTLAAKAVSPKGLTILVPRIREFLAAMKTDLSLRDIFFYVRELRKCDMSAMEVYVPEGRGVTIGDGSYYALDADSVLTIVNDAFNPYDRALTRADLIVRGA